MILILPSQNIETSPIQMILVHIGKQLDSKVESSQTEVFTPILYHPHLIFLLLFIYSL